jgi:predicted nucleotidyltransferase
VTVATTQFAEILRVLDRHGVNFVVVGSTAGVLAGAGYTTKDVDVVVEYSEANLARLVDALVDLDARYQDFVGRTIRPDANRLRANRLNILITRLGQLDILRKIEPNRDYGELLGRSEVLDVEGMQVRTVDLETLIEAKQIANRDKDKLHLLFLRETLRLRRLKEGGS